MLQEQLVGSKLQRLAMLPQIFREGGVAYVAYEAES